MYILNTKYGVRVFKSVEYAKDDIRNFQNTIKVRKEKKDRLNLYRRLKTRIFKSKIKYRIGLLIQFSKIKINNQKLYSDRRERKHWPKGLCQCCFKKAAVQHHIIGIANGGDDCKKNRINICDDCHYKIHPWLSMKKPEEIKNFDKWFYETTNFVK